MKLPRFRLRTLFAITAAIAIVIAGCFSVPIPASTVVIKHATKFGEARTTAFVEEHRPTITEAAPRLAWAIPLAVVIGLLASAGKPHS